MSELLDKYKTLMSGPPAPGTVLRTFTGVPATLTVQVDANKPPFIYGRAYVSEILNETLGWYLHESGSHGWRAILMTKARREVAMRCDLNNVLVRSLRVIRASESGKSLLCEVAEYDCV